MPVVDLSGVTTEFTAIPAGEYQAIFAKYVNGVGKTSGEPKVTLRFAIADGEYEGRVLFSDCSLQPHALFAIKRALLAMGADPEDLEHSIDTDEELDRVIGSRVRLVVSTKPKNDGTGDYNNVENILAF